MWAASPLLRTALSGSDTASRISFQDLFRHAGGVPSADQKLAILVALPVASLVSLPLRLPGRDGEAAKSYGPNCVLNANITHMEDVTAHAPADQQVAQATAAELESLSLECRADAARFSRLLAPDFLEFGTSGTEIGYEGTAARVAVETNLAARRFRSRTCGDGCWPMASSC